MRQLILCASLLPVLAALGAPARAQPKTIQDALAAAYSNNPTLQTSRASLRVTDEGVPQALAGWPLAGKIVSLPLVALSGYVLGKLWIFK